jgi:hypothetical protein
MDRRSARDLRGRGVGGSWGSWGSSRGFPRQRGRRVGRRYALRYGYVTWLRYMLTNSYISATGSMGAAFRRREKAGQLPQLPQLPHALVPCAKRTHAPTADQHGRIARPGLHRRRRRGKPASWEPRDGCNAALRANLKACSGTGDPRRPHDDSTRALAGRLQGSMDASHDPVCIGGVGVASRHRGSRTAAATPRSSQPDACLGAETPGPGGHFSMRDDPTLEDRPDVQSESAMRCRPACAVPKPSRDGCNTIENLEHCASLCANPSWRACSVEVVAGRELPSLRCRRRMHATAPAWQRDANEPSRRAQERWRSAAAARPLAWSPTADSVKCEGTDKAKGVSQGCPTRGVLHVASGVGGSGQVLRGCLPKKDHARRPPAGAEATNVLFIGVRAARAHGENRPRAALLSPRAL